MELSKRLQAVTELLNKHHTVADIGCDHGFISIDLIRKKKAEYCIAMDVNEGPIERAKENIEIYGMSTYVQTRLSDGAKKLSYLSSGRLEADAAVIAGMGGKLTIKIMEDSLNKFMAMEEFILQPQSELAKVREYLQRRNFIILAEDMVEEEGKFYPMMKVSFCHDHTFEEKEEQELFFHYGELLLTLKHPVLYRFLKKEEKLYEEIYSKLNEKETDKTVKRLEEIKKQLILIRKGLSWYNNGN